MTEPDHPSDEPTGADLNAESDEGPPQPERPTPEQYAARARRADKATKGALAGVLGLEAVIVLLVPRAIAFSTGLSTTRTTLCIVLAVLLILAAGLVRRPRGIAVGSVLQVAVLGTGFMIGTMFLLGALFIAVWLRILLLRHEIVGSPGGVRMLAG
jgi:hypothetical protein